MDTEVATPHAITLAQALPGTIIDGFAIAGIILRDDGTFYAPGIGAEDLPAANWNAQLERASEAGLDLMDRREARLAWVNLKHLFNEDTAYWLKEQSAVSSCWAWVQDFDDGYQHDDGKKYELLARAVRRFEIIQ